MLLHAKPDLFWVGEWLCNDLPKSPHATLVHGGYRLGNLVLSNTFPVRVSALLDWELATLGDPLADLGYFLSFWTDPDDPPAPFEIEMTRFTCQPGFLRFPFLTQHQE